MSWKAKCQEAKTVALVANTAQEVFKDLTDIANKASLHRSRWIWELLQNARDTAPESGGLAVKVRLDEDQFVFEHNGEPFSIDEVAHLVYHGSTKERTPGQAGQFGTGFLSTHVISRCPTVSGCLSDGGRFEFILRRKGDSWQELSRSMDESYEEFENSITDGDSGDSAGFTTRYLYPLVADTAAIAADGISSLEKHCSYVLVFNPSINCIEISHGPERSIYRRGPGETLSEHLQLIPVCREDPSGSLLESCRIALATDDDVAVAIKLVEQDRYLRAQVGPEVPKLFTAFPLFGTEHFCLTGVVNSLAFKPKEDRRGVYLGEDATPDNQGNKRLVERACGLLVDLLRTCVTRGWEGLHLLCAVRLGDLPEDVDASWLRRVAASLLVEKIRSHRLFPTVGGELIPPRSAWVPQGSDGVTSEDLWDLAHGLTESETRLPPKENVGHWAENVQGWATTIGRQMDSMEESLTLHRLAGEAASLGSLTGLGGRLRSDVAPIDWVNRLLRLASKAGQLALLDSLAPLPDQNGDFRKRSELSGDTGIDEELKDITEALGVEVRSTLLDRRVSVLEVTSLLQTKTEESVLAQALTAVRKEAESETPSEGYRQANIDLFAWIMRRRHLPSLESFPALTMQSAPEEEAPTHVILRSDGSAEDLPLAPPACWPEKARPHAAIFPSRYVLSPDYLTKCSEEDLWQRASRRGIFRIAPVYKEQDHVQHFLPDENLTDDATHKSKEPVTMTRIAFLHKKNVGLLDTARKSKARCIAMWKFLMSYVLQEDRSWQETASVTCECDHEHAYRQAAWLAPLREDRWICCGKSRPESPSAEVLARLLDGEQEILETLGQEEGAAFLELLGVSAGDLLLRSVTDNEITRLSLSRSMVAMFRATGRDSSQVGMLAEEIATHPETLTEIEKRRETRRKVRRNQAVGELVEKAFRAALRGERFKVERRWRGMDCEVENDYLDEAAREILLDVGAEARSMLVEIKATTTAHVRMTETQGKTARDEAERFMLCVVPLPSHDTEITEDTIKVNAQFVADIGNQVRSLVEAVEAVAEAREGMPSEAGDIELEVRESDVRYKIASEVWRAGLSFDDAVAYLRRALSET